MKKWLTALMALPFFASSLLAQEEALPAREQGFSQTLIMIGIALLFFYFILWRPEKKRRKAAEQRRNSMKKGDEVTAMGILGTIHKVEDTDTVIIEMYDGSKIRFLKAAISDVQPGTQKEKHKAEEKDSKRVDLVQST